MWIVEMERLKNFVGVDTFTKDAEGEGLHGVGILALLIDLEAKYKHGITIGISSSC